MFDPSTHNRPFADKRDKVCMDGVPYDLGLCHSIKFIIKFLCMCLKILHTDGHQQIPPSVFESIIPETFPCRKSFVNGPLCVDNAKPNTKKFNCNTCFISINVYKHNEAHISANIRIP